MLFACYREKHTLVDVCVDLALRFSMLWQKLDHLRCDRLRNAYHSIEVTHYPVAGTDCSLYVRIVERQRNVDLDA